MKAIATLKNLDSHSSEKIIVRNLSRIMDIVIIDIDIEKGALCFLYNGQKSFDQVKRELDRIGYPIENYTNKLSRKIGSRNLVSSSRARGFSNIVQ